MGFSAKERAEAGLKVARCYVVAGPRIWKLLEEDGEIHKFYNSHFHTMKDEYNAKS